MKKLQGIRKWSAAVLFLSVGTGLCIAGIVPGADYIEWTSKAVIAFFAANLYEWHKNDKV